MIDSLLTTVGSLGIVAGVALVFWLIPAWIVAQVMVWWEER